MNSVVGTVGGVFSCLKAAYLRVPSGIRTESLLRFYGEDVVVAHRRHKVIRHKLR